MNLLAKRAGWLILSVTILFWGCKEDVGIELPPDVQRTEVKYAEFILPVTNVYFDSLRTDSRGASFLGLYDDPTYGSISSKVYTEFRYKSGSIEEEITVVRGSYDELIRNIELESISINFDVNNVLSNTSELSQQVQISTLQDTIYADGLYLRDREIPIDETLITSEMTLNRLDTINFASNTIHQVSAELPNSFGYSLINLFEDEGTTMQPLGLVLDAISSNGIFSFDMTSDASEIAIQMTGQLYDTLGQIKKDTTFTALSFTLNNTAANYFSKIDRDRSGSIFSGVIDKTEFDPSGDFAYYNLLAGIFPKVSLAPLIEFAEAEPGILFNQVIMEIPVQENPAFVPHMDLTYFYFPVEKNNKISIDWAGTLSSPNYFGTTMQSDIGYTQSSSNAIFSNDTISTDPITYRGFLGSPSVFTQHIYDNIQDDLENVKVENRPLIRGYLQGVDNLIMMPGNLLLLGRNAIGKESVKLKVFYTQLKQ